MPGDLLHLDRGDFPRAVRGGDHEIAIAERDLLDRHVIPSLTQLTRMAAGETSRGRLRQGATVQHLKGRPRDEGEAFDKRQSNLYHILGWQASRSAMPHSQGRVRRYLGARRRAAQELPGEAQRPPGLGLKNLSNLPSTSFHSSASSG